MSRSRRSSSASASCRLEWRPSRWLCASLVSLGLMAMVAVLASNLPAVLAWPAAAVALFTGLRQALLEWRRAPFDFVFDGSGLGASVAGGPVCPVRVQWRGALAFATWREAGGRVRRVSWWPDTLPAPARRELRLATGQDQAARRPRQMAP